MEEHTMQTHFAETHHTETHNTEAHKHGKHVFRFSMNENFAVLPPKVKVPHFAIYKADDHHHKDHKPKTKSEKDIEAKRQLIRDTHKRNMEYTKLSEKKIDDYWTELFEKKMSNDMKNGLHFLHRYTASELNIKQGTIDMLLEEQFYTNKLIEDRFNHHLAMLEYLEGHLVYTEKVLHEIHDNKTQEELRRYMNHKEDIERYFKQSFKHLDQLNGFSVVAFNEYKKEEEAQLKMKHMTIQNNQKLDLEILTNKYVDEMILLQKQINEIFKCYTKCKKSGNFKDSEEYKRDVLEKGRLLAKVNFLTKLDNSLTMKIERRLSDLRTEYNYFHSIYWPLKVKYMNSMKTDKIKIGLMCSKAKKIVDYLERVSKKGNRLISLSDCCRRMLTEKEKVMGDEEVLQNLMDHLQHPDPLPKIVNRPLKNVHKRINKIIICNHELANEKERLIAENKKLREIFYGFKSNRVSTVPVLPKIVNNTVTIPVQEAALMPMFRKIQKRITSKCSNL